MLNRAFVIVRERFGVAFGQFRLGLCLFLIHLGLVIGIQGVETFDFQKERLRRETSGAPEHLADLAAAG